MKAPKQVQVDKKQDDGSHGEKWTSAGKIKKGNHVYMDCRVELGEEPMREAFPRNG